MIIVSDSNWMTFLMIFKTFEIFDSQWQSMVICLLTALDFVSYL